MPDAGKQFLDQLFGSQGVPDHSLYVHVKYWTIVPIEGSKRLLVPIPELTDEQGFIMQLFNWQASYYQGFRIKLGECPGKAKWGLPEQSVPYILDRFFRVVKINSSLAWPA